VERAQERFPKNVTCKTCHKLVMERKEDRLIEMDLRTLRTFCKDSKVPGLQLAMKACSKFLNIVQQVRL